MQEHERNPEVISRCVIDEQSDFAIEEASFHSFSKQDKPVAGRHEEEESSDEHGSETSFKAESVVAALQELARHVAIAKPSSRQQSDHLLSVH